MRTIVALAFILAATAAPVVPNAQPAPPAPAPAVGAIPPYGAPIELPQARWAVQAAEARAKAMGTAMVIVVVEPTGDMVLLEKMPGASYGSIKVAQAKARAAALYRFSTKTMADLQKTGVDFGAFPDAIPLEGGIPIVAQGHIVGAIGVSGGQPEQDGMAAQAGADAVASLSAPPTPIGERG
jgi:uncharacterized protein GlcG (DUF336 family)